jgi:hypothetical protein
MVAIGRVGVEAGNAPMQKFQLIPHKPTRAFVSTSLETRRAARAALPELRTGKMQTEGVAEGQCGRVSGLLVRWMWTGVEETDLASIPRLIERAPVAY